MAEKRTEGVSGSVVAKYERELKRLRLYCQGAGVYFVQGMTREVLAGYCGTWADAYPSTITRSKVRERLRTFLRYCYEAGHLERIPGLPKIKVDEAPTMPLVGDEYERLLAAVPGIHPLRGNGKPSSKTITPEMLTRVRALIQLMRWSGLAIGDGVTLERERLTFDNRHQLWRVTTTRQKTGTDVSVVIPTDVAEELLKVWELSPNKRYLFWAGKGKPSTVSYTWAKRYIRPSFVGASISCESHMVSHRLRDTFAVDLLENGVPLEEVSKALGHESIKTTEKHYAKWVKSRQDRLDGLVIGTWKQKPKKRAA